MKIEASKKGLIIPYLMLFSVIYFGHETVVTRLRISSEVIPLIIIFTSLFLGIISQILVKQNIRLNKYALLVFTLTVCNIGLTMLLNSDYSPGNYLVLINVFIALILSQLITFDEFINCYCKILLILAIYSIIITYLVKFIPLLSSFLPTYYNRSGVPYIDAGLCFIMDLPSVFRNIGIFREPGVYQFFLTVALCFSIFYKKEKKLLYITVFTVTLITTFSTIGIIQAILLLIVVVFSKKNLNVPTTKLVIIGVFFITVIITLYNIVPEIKYSFNITFLKLFKGTPYHGSTLARVSSVIAGIVTGSQSPIVGFGMSKGFNKISSISDYVNASSTALLFAYYGLLLPILNIICFFLLSIKIGIGINTISKFIVFLVLILSVNSQVLIFDCFIYIIMFSIFMKTEYKKSGVICEVKKS